MSRFNYEMTPEKIERFIKEGRGKGKGKSYKPWLTVFDVPSRGLVTRSKGVKTGRIHHTLSENETRALFIFEMCPAVVDIREQFPLFPQKETLLIADHLGIKHPKDPKTKTPIVMTTDFLVTLIHDGKELEVARTIKPETELINPRVVEKLEIERVFWKSRGIDWAIIPDTDGLKILGKNCELFRDYLKKEELQVEDQDFQDILSILDPQVLLRNNPLRFITRECDRHLGLPAGTSLKVAYHSIATRKWIVNLVKPFNPGEILDFEAVDSLSYIFGALQPVISDRK